MIRIDLMVVWEELSTLKGGKHFLLVSRWDRDVLHSKLWEAERAKNTASSVFEGEAV